MNILQNLLRFWRCRPFSTFQKKYQRFKLNLTHQHLFKNTKSERAKMSKLLPKILLIFGVALIVYSKYTSALYSSLGFAIIGYLATDALIPRVSDSFIKIGLYGKDLSKPGKPVIAETIGAVSATVYLFVMFLSIPFVFYKYLVVTSGGGNRDSEMMDKQHIHLVFPHGRLSAYLSALLCLHSTVLLGVADDLFDLRWRHKFFLPSIAAIPLLVVYYADFGVTYVLVPNFVRDLFPALRRRVLFDLGWFYYVYMAAMAIFCPNAINILAGVNGLEVLQAIVLGVICLLNDVLYMSLGPEQTKESHLFSMVMIIPFIGVSLALWKWNRWPARVFVGDTYCYFAGMVFAVVGILGHFSKTMLLFFIPQIVNFLYSVPQLFGLVPCPRHRLPKFNEKDGLLYTSRANLTEKPAKPFFVTILKYLYRFKLIDLTLDSKGNPVDCSNMTLINLVLVWFGPMREDKLCFSICGLQFAVGLLCLFARHAIGSLIFGHDNLWHVA
ncbi:UDP-N-acetylglucosamine--dolichyl-phosphate N-acetylglucosaminephosphotransferase Ecym_2259 [Eremothecium cymbalariae DBVPG|uniref:UDP-N-acetylglucosamine--dolichyl-phosphate N-acetylglucosaminephosphotransferase n=1 Tax=Eremothecium cymbalariae (strain CBS 270.75 / DBVPG 7215 / KCTC 17166 / NRRL Y-17582) TaxID=931890 RepID=G8JPQ0_ERECY|nr:Hypothetical protein Ecym_2259 [Eremothecium cymbalariae DBVPG\